MLNPRGGTSFNGPVYRGLRPKRVPFSGFGYIGTRYTDTRLVYNIYNGQFRLSQRKFHFFFAKINLLNTVTS